ncbi:hypothetical protein AB9C19_25425, partial [Escherichia coli]
MNADAKLHLIIRQGKRRFARGRNGTGTESEYLTGLDREIGDADHGLNMNRGFSKVVEKLPAI